MLLYYTSDDVGSSDSLYAGTCVQRDLYHYIMENKENDGRQDDKDTTLELLTAYRWYKRRHWNFWQPICPQYVKQQEAEPMILQQPQQVCRVQEFVLSRLEAFMYTAMSQWPQNLFCVGWKNLCYVHYSEHEFCNVSMTKESFSCCNITYDEKSWKRQPIDDTREDIATSDSLTK